MPAKLKNIIKYNGLNDLGELERYQLKNIVEKEYEEVHKLFSGSITDLCVHIKTIDKGGAAKKYILKIRAEAPTRIFAADVTDIDLNRAARKVIEKLKNEINNAFKPKEKWWGKRLRRKLKDFSFYWRKK